MPEKKDDDKTGMYTFGRYLSVGLMLPVATMVGYGAGYEIDKYAGTHHWAMILMILGTVGGFVQLIREVTRG
jgi:F0F1-type ATP synthase assembly protein I